MKVKACTYLKALEDAVGASYDLREFVKEVGKDSYIELDTDGSVKASYLFTKGYGRTGMRTVNHAFAKHDGKLEFLIINEEALNEIKEPLVSFHSANKTIQSLLADPDVKKYLSVLLKEGHPVTISRKQFSDYNNTFAFDWNANNWEPVEENKLGQKILDETLDELKIRNTSDTEWLGALPYVVIASTVLGAFAGSGYGYVQSLLEGSTYYAGEAKQLLYAGWGALIGFLGSLTVAGAGAAIHDGASVIKDKFEEPIHRIGLVDKVKAGL